MEIMKIQYSEYYKVKPLILETFMKFEAPDYPPAGVETFKSALQDVDYMGNLCMYAAFEGDTPMGIIAFRNEGTHIALFFVDEKFQHRGVGRKLFSYAVEDIKCTTLTVNSSPYAESIYAHLGFVKAAEMQISDGIKYIPMVYKNSKEMSL